ncbi:DUF5403 family protein [Nocardia terpenica]|uniref:DUF5403 family protein n=1 Tax=Nocardia terpenica TaxID=455432 RepID=UPI001E563857|nr:DUF5403 family protein [Nocardia terpenica]
MIGQKAMNQVVSHVDGVKDAIGDEAKEIGSRAEARLAGHRRSGRAQVTVTNGDVDSFVNLEDPAALSIEFGHMVKGKYETEEPKYVPGLYIITGAAGLAG